jgi:Ala-tRNA(Pro) deacylase
MPVQRLKDYLDERHIKYSAIQHAPAYTAQEIAARAHVKGKELAKTVVLKLDGELALAVLPASARIDLELLKSSLGAEKVELASEREFGGKFPGCEVGAMPPFGALYGMRTYVADCLAEDEKIAFNAGSHTELLRLAYEDFARLEQPTTLEFTVGSH